MRRAHDGSAELAARPRQAGTAAICSSTRSSAGETKRTSPPITGEARGYSPQKFWDLDQRQGAAGVPLDGLQLKSLQSMNGLLLLLMPSMHSALESSVGPHTVTFGFALH